MRASSASTGTSSSTAVASTGCSATRRAASGSPTACTTRTGAPGAPGGGPPAASARPGLFPVVGVRLVLVGLDVDRPQMSPPLEPLEQRQRAREILLVLDPHRGQRLLRHRHAAAQREEVLAADHGGDAVRLEEGLHEL